MDRLQNSESPTVVSDNGFHIRLGCVKPRHTVVVYTVGINWGSL